MKLPERRLSDEYMLMKKTKDWIALGPDFRNFLDWVGSCDCDLLFEGFLSLRKEITKRKLRSSATFLQLYMVYCILQQKAGLLQFNTYSEKTSVTSR